MATAWETDLGVFQGRVQPSLEEAPDGDYVYVLGADRENREVRLEAGDHVELSQGAVDLSGVNTVRVRAALRAPADTPAGHVWRASLRVDGAEYARRDAWPGQTREVELALNAGPLAGDHEVAFRLELVEV